MPSITKLLPPFLAVVVASLALAGPASAATAALVVDPVGVGGRCDDTRLATQVAAATPLCSVAVALKAAVPGQSILLRRGNHASATVAGVGGVTGGPIAVRPWPGEEAGVSSGGIFLTSAHDVRISGLKASMLQVRTGDRIELSNNDVKSIYLRDTGAVRVTGNQVHDAPFESAGILVQGIGRGTRDLVVSDNRIWGLTGDGIDIFNGANSVRLERNEISGLTLAAGSKLHVDAIQFMPGDNYTIADNYIHDAIHGVLINGGLTRYLRMTGNRLVRVGGNPVQIFGTPGAIFCRNVVLEKLAGEWAPSLFVAHDPAAASSGVVVGENDFGRWKAEAGTLAPASVTCPAA